LDIFAPSRVIIPCVKRFWNGSSLSSRSMSLNALVKNRAYSRWRIACSMPPMYWSTFIHASATRRSQAAWSFCASV
jgi:hypothetical protein